jgi:hypothetical protein
MQKNQKKNFATPFVFPQAQTHPLTSLLWALLLYCHWVHSPGNPKEASKIGRPKPSFADRCFVVQGLKEDEDGRREKIPLVCLRLRSLFLTHANNCVTCKEEDIANVNGQFEARVVKQFRISNNFAFLLPRLGPLLYYTNSLTDKLLKNSCPRPLSAQCK